MTPTEIEGGGQWTRLHPLSAALVFLGRSAATESAAAPRRDRAARSAAPFPHAAGVSFGLVRTTSAFRLSQSSIGTPFLRMMMPCWRIDRKLFHAQ